MEKQELVARALQQGHGIFRLAPVWVSRSFCRPGKRIKLHPDDYYALGAGRGRSEEHTSELQSRRRAR